MSAQLSKGRLDIIQRKDLGHPHRKARICRYEVPPVFRFNSKMSCAIVRFQHRKHGPSRY